MALPVGQIALLTVSVIGFALNFMVGGIVTFGLKLASADLMMVAIIATNDLVYYGTNILRAILIGTEVITINSNTLYPDPIWWCRYDVALTLPTLESSIELVAILSVMRYVKIFKSKTYPDWVWFVAAGFSLLLSAVMSMGNNIYGYFHWSTTNMYCLPGINENPLEGPNNKAFYAAFFTIFVIRYLISLAVISFCYFSISRAYRSVLRQSLTDNNNSNQYRMEYTSFKNEFNEDGHSNNEEAVSKSYLDSSYAYQSFIALVKLVAPTLAYLICLLPDTAQTFGDLVLGHEFGVPVNSVINCLACSSGIVSALFVLFSHAHTRNYFFKILGQVFKN